MGWVLGGPHRKCLVHPTCKQGEVGWTDLLTGVNQPVFSQRSDDIFHGCALGFINVLKNMSVTWWNKNCADATILRVCKK